MVPRRSSLKGIGLALATIGAAWQSRSAQAASLIPAGARTLDELTAKLEKLPRRRDFKTVPMILESREQWDADALDAVLHYAGGPKQSWDNTDLTGPWLNVMRNAMNAEVFSFKHPDFLCVSATHGSAQLALYDDAMWEKYNLAKLAHVTRNSFVAAPADLERDRHDVQAANGPYSSRGSSIQALQQRGAVFLACHNAIWELAERLIKADANPDHLTAEALCAELTNHLVPGIILNPGAVATLVELQVNGFTYA